MRRLGPVLVLLGLLLPGAAAAHELGAGASTAGLPGFRPFAAPMPGEPYAPTTTSEVIDGREGSTFEGGPCTGAAKQAWPDGAGHDHLDPAQHRFACDVQQVAFLSLEEELGDRPDVILGEMDIKAGIAAVAVAYPEAGALFFDVSRPGKPKFLSWWRGGECEGAVIDIDCGAFVDLSKDGKTAFVSTQNTSVLPGALPPLGTLPTTVPGVYTIDLRTPTAPRLTDVFAVANAGGVHTARSHVIKGTEYVFTNTLSALGATDATVDVLRVDRVGGLPRLTKVSEIAFDELHDTFIQDDPDGRTYLYVASGFSSGFYVHDVTDPAAPVLKAEWDLTPQCAQDWYSHTIDVVHRNGRRYVTLPSEMITTFGEQDAEDQAEGCGKLAGNGDAPGPLWIVDATDLSKLGPAETVGPDDEPALARASRDALVATWTNPADRNGGNLSFSPHNQQVVGDRIYLSNYHGGVYVLDASAAFRGERVRPKEVGFVVPAAAETRPIYEPAITPALPFFSTFPAARPEIWDTYAYEGHIYAADMRGGLYAFAEAPTVPVAPGEPAQLARQRPQVLLSVKRLSGCRVRAKLVGTGVPAVKRVGYRFGTTTVKAKRGVATRRTRKRQTVTAKVTFSDGQKVTLTRRLGACA